MALEKAEIANRLREFGMMKFGNMKKLADALEMSQASLHSGYLSGRSIPGAEILVKLNSIGCDILWLLTGKENNESNLKAKIIKLETEIRVNDERWNEFTNQVRMVADQSAHYGKKPK